MFNHTQGGYTGAVMPQPLLAAAAAVAPMYAVPAVMRTTPTPTASLLPVVIPSRKITHWSRIQRRSAEEQLGEPLREFHEEIEENHRSDALSDAETGAVSPRYLAQVMNAHAKNLMDSEAIKSDYISSPESDSESGASSSLNPTTPIHDSMESSETLTPVSPTASPCPSFSAESPSATCLGILAAEASAKLSVITEADDENHAPLSSVSLDDFDYDADVDAATDHLTPLPQTCARPKSKSGAHSHSLFDRFSAKMPLTAIRLDASPVRRTRFGRVGDSHDDMCLAFGKLLPGDVELEERIKDYEENIEDFLIPTPTPRRRGRGRSASAPTAPTRRQLEEASRMQQMMASASRAQMALRQNFDFYMAAAHMAQAAVASTTGFPSLLVDPRQAAQQQQHVMHPSAYFHSGAAQPHAAAAMMVPPPTAAMQYPMHVPTTHAMAARVPTHAAYAHFQGVHHPEAAGYFAPQRGCYM